MSDETYNAGGYIPGGPVPARLDPAECVVDRECRCVRRDEIHTPLCSRCHPDNPGR